VERDGVPVRCTLREWSDSWPARFLRRTGTPAGWVATIFEGHDPYVAGLEVAVRDAGTPGGVFAGPERLYGTGAFLPDGRCVHDERYASREEAFAAHDVMVDHLSGLL
jgi:hypothetical protein